jgi:hypothetical protein
VGINLLRSVLPLTNMLFHDPITDLDAVRHGVAF